MANVALMVIDCTSLILQSLPRIMKMGHELYSLWCQQRSTRRENDAVLRAMKLLNKQQDDIDRLLQDPQKKRDLLEGLTILVNKINQTNPNEPGTRGRNMATAPSGEECGALHPKASKESRWRECDVCRYEYNNSIKRPAILYCGHTFCRECLGELSRRGSISCPTCREPESRPLASIPTNTGLMQVLEWDGKNDDNCCSGGEKGSKCGSDGGECGSSGGECDSLSLPYEQQIQFAIFLSQQEAQTHGAAHVEKRWREVEEAEMVVQAMQDSEMFEASRLCAQRYMDEAALDPPDKEEEKAVCGGASASAAPLDDDASMILALELHQEEIAKMQRLCGNKSDDWDKEMQKFFGSSLYGSDEGGQNLVQGEENTRNRTWEKEDEDGEDGGLCCRRSEDERKEEEEEDSGKKCMEDEEESGKKSVEDDEEDVGMCCSKEEDEGDCRNKCLEDDSGKAYVDLMRREEDLLLQMAIRLSLEHQEAQNALSARE